MIFDQPQGFCCSALRPLYTRLFPIIDLLEFGVPTRMRAGRQRGYYPCGRFASKRKSGTADLSEDDGRDEHFWRSDPAPSRLQSSTT